MNKTTSFAKYQFIARQPIFTKDKSLFAYELLYRTGEKKNFNDQIKDGDQASKDVLVNAITVIGLDNLVNGKKAFINFTYNLLKDKELLYNLSPENIIIEILEDVKIDNEMIELIRNLKAKGYTIALDDYEHYRYEYYQKLFPYVDIIKVDFMLNRKADLQEIPKKLPGKTVLAEKVESNEVFEFAVENGYRLFQGFFFSKPQIVKEKDIPINSLINTKILEEINRDNYDLKKIASLIEADVSLTYKLLKLINAAYHSRSKEIRSVMQATALLGAEEIKRLIYMSLLSKNRFEGANEVIKNSLLRAKFCEIIGGKFSNKFEKSEFFLTGMLSMIDVILQMKMEKILSQLPLSKHIKRALLKHDNELYYVLDLFTRYEKGDWKNIINLYSGSIDLKDIEQSYIQSIAYAEELIGVV